MDNKGDPIGRSRYLPGFSIPIQALFIQLIAFFLALFFLKVIFRISGWAANPLVFGLVQGTSAALISRFRRLPLWWLPIQFLFPLAMFLLLALQIPPVWYFGAFFILSLLFWGAIVNRVPLYLSGHAVWDAVLAQLPQNRPLRIIDIGSGLGGLVLYLASKRLDCTVSGIEISPFLWGVSYFRKKISGSAAHFILGNYEKIRLNHYDVVFSYLSPIVMDSLWIKAESEMRKGSLFLSFEFPVEDIEPDIQISIGNKTLFGWFMGKSPSFSL